MTILYHDPLHKVGNSIINCALRFSPEEYLQVNAEFQKYSIMYILIEKWRTFQLVYT